MINIVIDGVDCTGKETQTKLLYEALSASNMSGVNLYSFPKYESPTGGIIKSYLDGNIQLDNIYARSGLFALDRYMELERNPPNVINIFDRYTQSNLIYSTIGMSNDELIDYVDYCHEYEYVKLGLPIPDIVIFLYLPPDKIVEAIHERGNKVGEELDINERDSDFIRSVCVNASHLANTLNWNVINCWDTVNNRMRSINDIHNEIMNINIVRR